MLFISILFLGGCSNTASTCSIEDLTVNYRTNPLSIRYQNMELQAGEYEYRITL